MRRPPLVSAEWPWRSWNMLPQAFATAAIFAITGRLCITNDTSFFWCLARFCAWPRRPNPVTSVAPWALYLCMRRAAVKSNKKTWKYLFWNNTLRGTLVQKKKSRVFSLKILPNMCRIRGDFLFSWPYYRQLNFNHYSHWNLLEEKKVYF